MITTKEKGALLVEVLIGSAIIASVLVLLAGSLVRFNLLAVDNLRRTQAAFLATEGLEAVRSLRDTSWTEAVATLTPNTDYYLAWQGDQWSLSATPSLVDGRFDRAVRVEEVYRDANNDIAETGTLDPDTWLVTASVSWPTGRGTTTKQLSAYLTNLFDN
jgi:type II secretory pathway pseudopilin PulG